MNYSVPLENSLISGVFNNLFYEVGTKLLKTNNLVLEQQRNQPRYNIKELANQENIQETFSKLAKQWNDETIDSSSLTEILYNDNYDAIIALGRPVLAILFRELEREPNYWFRAITAILRANNEYVDVVDESEYGDLRKMTEAWLEWGVSSGYLEKS